MPTSLRAIAEKASTTGPVRKRTVLKSPVRENCTPGSVRGRSGDWPTYLDVRQHKSGSSYGVRVPVEQDVTDHSYRVLQRCTEAKPPERNCTVLWRTAWLKRRQGMFQAAREDRASLKQFSPVTKQMKAGGDPVNDEGSQYKAAVKVRLPKACRGPRAWHGTREESGSWEAPWFPAARRVGIANQKEGEPTNDAGVRSSGSTCGKRPGEADDRTVQSTKETSASTINWGIAMPTSLWAIADKARADKQHRFGGVARLLTPGN